MGKLSGQEIKQSLRDLRDWKKKGGIISRTFQWKNFLGSIRFVNQVAKAAEKANHHPDIDIRWNKVKLQLTTHDQGGLTAKDIEMAKRCDLLAQKNSR